MDTGDTVNTDPIEISNILDTHFSKIGPSLASEISDRGLDVLTERQRGQYIRTEV